MTVDFMINLMKNEHLHDLKLKRYPRKGGKVKHKT